MLSSKPKITIKELKDIYDIEEDDGKGVQGFYKDEKSKKEIEFEVTIEQGDKKLEEEMDW